MKNYTNKDIVRGIVVADGPETNNVLITKKATVYLHGDTNFANTSKYADSVLEALVLMLSIQTVEMITLKLAMEVI